jgi:hypothetical protein
MNHNPSIIIYFPLKKNTEKSKTHAKLFSHVHVRQNTFSNRKTQKNTVNYQTLAIIILFIFINISYNFLRNDTCIHGA